MSGKRLIGITPYNGCWPHPKFVRTSRRSGFLMRNYDTVTIAEPRKALKTGARRRRNQPGLVHGQKSRAYRHLIRSRVIVQLVRLSEDLARIVAIIHLRPREYLADGKIVN